MKTLSNYFMTAKNSLNRKPFFDMQEIDTLCGQTPNVNIGKFNLKTNFIRRSIMRILSIAAAGALIIALYLFNHNEDTRQTIDYQNTSAPEPEQILAEAMNIKDVTSKRSKTESQINYNYTADFDDIPAPDNNLYASALPITKEDFRDDDTPKNESTLMGYPIMVLSKEEAEKIGFIYNGGEVRFRYKGRMEVPYEDDFVNKDNYNEHYEDFIEEMKDKSYDIKKDTLVFSEIKISNEFAFDSNLDKKDAKELKFNNINPITLQFIRKKVKGNSNYIYNNIISPAPPYQLSQYMTDTYKTNICMFNVQKIVDNNLFEDYSHFYVDTNYKVSEVFKKFVNIIIPIEDEEYSLTLSGWFLLNKELASKLPKRYQMELKHKFQITEQDYYSEDSQRIAVFIDEDSNLPWSKISFVPNHFPIYGTTHNGEYREVYFGNLDKIISYLSAKLPKHLIKEISQSSRNTIDILNEKSSSSNEVKLLITILKADKIKASSINSLELDDKKLSKLGVDKTKNKICFTTESIFKDNKLQTIEYLYRFSHDEIDHDDNEKFLSRGAMRDEYYNFASHILDTHKMIHNYNPALPAAYSLKGQYTFLNSPCTYFSKDKSIKDIFKQAYSTVIFSQRIDTDIKYPIYLHNGTKLKKIGTDEDLVMPYLEMLDRLIPIKIETGFKHIPGPLYLWYLPTTEFLNALPERYSKSIRKELAILDKIENQNVEPEKACKGFDEESFLGICDLSSGALSNIKIAPNPCMFDLDVTFNATDKRTVNIEIFDINGRNVKTLGNFNLSNFGEQSFSFDISQLRTGLYQLVIISDQGEKISKRFIKQ